MKTDAMVKLGLFGIGLDTYWPQFNGLRDRLLGYQGQIGQRIKNNGVQLVDAGLVDSPEKALEAASLFRREEVEFIFLYISTYALNSTVLPVVQHVGVPVVMLNFQPVSAQTIAWFHPVWCTRPNCSPIAATRHSLR